MADLEADLQTLPAEYKTEAFASELYGALCNQGWRKGDTGFTCSWRYAGGVASELLGGDDYLEYYCSGNEEVITDTVREVLGSLGWEPCRWNVAAALETPQMRTFYLAKDQLETWLETQEKGTYRTTSWQDDCCHITIHYADGNDREYTVHQETGDVHEIVDGVAQLLSFDAA